MHLQGHKLARTAFLLLAVLVTISHANRTKRQSGFFPGSRPTCSPGTTCIPLTSCPSLRALLFTPTISNLRRLQRALCGFNRRNPRVCCPDDGPSTPQPTTQPPTRPTQPTQPTTRPTQPTTRPTQPTTRPTQPTTRPTQPTQPPTQPGDGSVLPARCGEPATTQTRIFFGQDAPLGLYPWIALLGFSSFGSNNIVWGCGGALINSRYVITAGHCTAEQFTLNRRISVVRLGEYDIGTPQDCERTQSGRFCAPTHIDFAPEQIIRHPDFNNRATVSDDIALIRLNQPVQFTGFIQPICLPALGETIPDLVGSRQAEVAGWGSTENGPNTQILQNVRLPFVGKDECNPHYNDGLIDEQVCFGGDGRRDSCFGDSGGPVMISRTNVVRYTLLALVSFGQPQCGVEGVPAVYTDVTAYRSWILSNLRP